MAEYDFSMDFRGSLPAYAVILGTNEIASAVAVFLRHAGYAVLLSHDPSPPVIRRGMAFHDALYGEAATVQGVSAVCIDSSFEIWSALKRPGAVVLVTRLGLSDLMVLGGIDILIDARMQKLETMPDFRNLARLTIGLGPGFVVGENCDVAIETRPARSGTVLFQGATETADGIVPMLGDVGAERFCHAETNGRWHTAIALGGRVFKGMVVGRLGATPILAPMDGVLRGSVRDGTEVPAGTKLIEIDPRGKAARWRGIEERARRIAEATFAATGLRTPRHRRNAKFPIG